MLTRVIRYFFSIVLLFCFFVVSAQKDTVEVRLKQFTVVEAPPEFPGGELGFLNFLKENSDFEIYPLKWYYEYPSESKNVLQRNSKEKRPVHKTVVIMFKVNADGTIKKAKLWRRSTKIYNKEAMRLSKLMPKWDAAVDKGKNVEHRFLVPIAFVVKE